MLNFIADTYRYAARVRYNNACLLVGLYSLRFSTKYRLILCNVRPRAIHAIAVIRRRVMSNTVAIQVIVFFQGGYIGRDVPMEIVVEV